MGISIYDNQYIFDREEHIVPTEIKNIFLEQYNKESKVNKMFTLLKKAK